MNIKRTYWVAVLTGLALGISAKTWAVTADVTVDCSQTGPATVQLAVSTFPVTNPATAFLPGTYLDKVTVPVLSISTHQIFTALPFLTAPTTYYFYAYIDSDANGMMGSTEPRGGYGPFPDHQVSAVQTAYADADNINSLVYLVPRASISGGITVVGGGERIVIRAIEDSATPTLDFVRQIECSTTSLSYVIDGLKPTANPYLIEAWIDRNSTGTNHPGQWDPDESKTVLPVGTLAGDMALLNQNITVSGNSPPDQILLRDADGDSVQSLQTGINSSALRISIRDVAGSTTTSSSTTLVYLSPYGGPVPQISTDNVNFFTLVANTPLFIPADQPDSPPFVARFSTTGVGMIKAMASDFPHVGDLRQSIFTFNIVASTSGPDQIVLWDADDDSNQIVYAGDTSSALRVSIRNVVGSTATSGNDTMVYLSPIVGMPQISTDAVTYYTMAANTPVLIPAGHWDSSPIRFRYYNPGTGTIGAIANNFPQPGLSRQANFIFQVNPSTRTPDHIRLLGVDGNSYQTTRSSDSSSDLRVSVRNVYDVLVPAVTTTTVFLRFYGDSAFYHPQWSTDTVNYADVTDSSSVVIPAGQSESPPFRVRFSAPGDIMFGVMAADFPFPGTNRFNYFNFHVLPENAQFTNLRARTNSQPSDTVGTAITISPDRDNINDGAVFTCTPPVASAGWELLISTDPSFPSQGIIQRQYGFGTSEVYWYGYGSQGGTVPNGLYYARFQTDGQAIVSSTMTVTVQCAGIRGVVLDEGSHGVGEAEVNVYGTSGGGYTRTGGDGSFVVNGLKEFFPYQIEIRKNGFLTVRLSTTTGSSAGPTLNLGSQTLAGAVNLAVSVHVSSAPTRDIYGGVSAHDASYTDNQWGSIRIASGSLDSDNGRYVADPQFSTITFVSVRPNTVYTVEVNLPDFGRSAATVTSPASGNLPVVFSMDRKPNVYGKVQFPAAMNSPYNGEWVSVDAQPNGAKMPTAWGGVWVNNGMTEGIYTLFGISPGTYTLRAFVRGYVYASTGVTVGAGDVGNSVSGGVDFPPFSTGGVLVGTVTVTGDSTSLATGYSGCGNNAFPVSLNAHSRANFFGAFTQTCVSQSDTVSSSTFSITGLADGTYELFSYLQGFEISPSGPIQVPVVSGVGHQDIEFRALTGQVHIQAQIPGGDDGALVHYQLEKGNPNPGQWSGFLSGSPLATGTVSGLGTGLYTLTVENQNPGRGLRQENILAVKNGASVTAPVDLTVPAYAVTGEIKVQGSIVLPSTWSAIVSSAPGLGAVGVTPQVDIYSLPFPDHYEYSNRPIQTVNATVHTTSATYDIPALAPGGYLLRVREDLNPPKPSCEGCWVEPGGLPEMANEGQMIYVGTAPLPGTDLTLSNGITVSGTLSRPTGDSSTDVRLFSLQLRRSDNYSLWTSSVATDASGAADYSFPHIAPGQYTLEITEQGNNVRYGATPQSITVAASDVSLAIPLVSGGTIVGRLRDADSQTIFTSTNVSQYLPSNFEIGAQANPWFPGGYAQAVRQDMSSSYAFDADGNFKIPRLIPGTSYDLRLRGYTGLTGDDIARGIKTYAPYVLSGIQVKEGQTTDVGIIDLKQGTSLTGQVVDVSSQPLANIRVMARPSLKTNGDNWSLEVESLTDENGRYEIHGIDRGQRYYDIIAAPRFRPGDAYAKLSGPRYAEERRRMIDVNTAAKLSGNNFTLSLANGAVVGRVETVDGGVLIPPFAEGKSRGGERGADLVLHRDGAAFDDNPLGEIEDRSAADGTFRVEGLKPGIYTLRSLAVGYVTDIKKITVPAGVTDVGLISLGRGASVSGTITKPDGSAPSSNEVNMVLGVDENFEDFLFGTTEVDNQTLEVKNYAISGFQPGKLYTFIIVTGKDDILEAKKGISFADLGESQVIPLEYRPSSPRVFVNQSQQVVGLNRITSVRFFVNQPVRNLTPSEMDPSTMIAVSSGVGSLSNIELNSSRDTLTADYTALKEEPSFGLRLAFYTNEKNPESADGENFKIDKTFAFYSGIAARKSATISNVTGGDCQMEGDAAGVTFPSGSFNVATSSAVDVEIRVLDELPTKAATASRAMGISRLAQVLGKSAYPSAALYDAAASAGSVNPFSAFYDIFLPAGINHVLKKDALLTLTYNPDSVSDPTRLNIYYYDPNNKLYLLENVGRTLDTVNHTITVSVSHLSAFMILENQAAVIGQRSSEIKDIRVFNTPNPFRIGTKDVTLQKGATEGQVVTVEGTVIRYSLPAGKAGEVKIDIYDVAGTPVRTLRQDSPADETYYYIPWDGRNDDGKKVASGLYLARFTLNGGDEKMFKMAVLK